MKPLAWVTALLALCAGMLHFGLWQFNMPNYPVKGVDVSHYQGDIDWSALAAGTMRFAFIKATEGSASRDDTFGHNLHGALNAGLRAGAYHFFSYDSPGAAQAENFIGAVPPWRGMLPPVIDVEFYGGYDRRPPDAAAVVPQLRDMVEALAAHYGMRPVIYATGKSFRLYIEGRFDDCDLWIRNVYAAPPSGWTFWQYSDRGRLGCTSGGTPYIDMNVFHGSAGEFEAYP